MITKIIPIDQLAYSRKIGENILIHHGNTSILIFHERSTLRLEFSEPQIDYLVLNSDSVDYIDDLFTYFDTRILILDASVSNSVATSIIEKMKEEKEIYSVSLEGALMINI